MPMWQPWVKCGRAVVKAIQSGSRYLGTGVGGGIIIDGRILTGTNGAGGEIGHIHIEDNETEVAA